MIEFAGPSARLLSVSDRAVLAALAPQLGASAAVFVSDEKTEVYLRDQRRSKAHRGLLPDPGAPCDDVISVDLSAVDPLVLDEDGVECADLQADVVQAKQALPEIAATEVPKDGERQAITLVTLVVRDHEGHAVYLAALTYTGTWLSR